MSDNATGRGKRRRATFIALLAVAGAWVTAPATPAVAAPGQLTYDGCLADTAERGCVDLPAAPLDGPNGIAVSADGKSVYVASKFSGSVDGSVEHFFRDSPSGQLYYDGCLANDATQGCVDLPGLPLYSASGVAVSPDGKSVYVVSSGSHSIAHFFRDRPGGQLHYDGCLANYGNTGCVDLPGQPIWDASRVAVSPDGKTVYVVSPVSDTVTQFDRTGPDGQITYAGCLANDVTPGTLGCDDLPGAPMPAPTDVAVSPDGRSVYVTSSYAGSIGILVRNAATGRLSWDGCLKNDGTENCGALPGAPLGGAKGVVVSPDGRSVYVASPGTHSIAHLIRAATGQLAWDGCLNNDGTENCEDLPHAPLSYAGGVAVSPDGKSVYVVSPGSNSVAHLATGPAGQLAWDGCVANDATEGCVDLPGAPLDQPTTVAASPDGRSVYVTSSVGASVAHFSRALATPAESAAGPAPSGAPSGASSPRPAFGASTKVTVKLAAGRIGARGPVRVLVSNANAFGVTGTLAGATTIRAKRGAVKLTAKRFAVAATGRTTVKLALSKALRRELQRRRKLVVRLSVVVADPAGNRRTVRNEVSPRLKPARRGAARA